MSIFYRIFFLETDTNGAVQIFFLEKSLTSVVFVNDFLYVFTIEGKTHTFSVLHRLFGENSLLPRVGSGTLPVDI